jgi:hypothetical protein
MRGWLFSAALGSALIVANPAAAQMPEMVPSGPVVIDGSPAPEPPEMLTRDGRGRATVRATRLSAPLRLDGQLDEAVYRDVLPFDGLIQAAPAYGAQASEKTDIWITFDADYIYVSARCWDSAPPETWIANELRRDTNQLRENENFGVMFDTYYDRRSGFFFYSNPLGALADYTVVDEGAPNKDWNPVWESRTGRFDGGWTVEMAIPFKTLRYRAGSNQIWGIQLRRAVRYKNEWTYLTPVPQNMAGPMGFNRVSAAGTLVGLDLPPASRNVEIKPYAISRLTTDRLASPRVTNEFTPDIGGDFKYGVTANLTADLTVNTDFAQVEVDEQQVNLTRFTLFFPEKRDFFLEGQGTFDFARGGTSGGGFFIPGGGGGNTDTPYLFYSRRIGLTNGREVPIVAGGRLTGKVGPFAVGLMNIQSGEEEVSNTPATNFTVVRVKRDILRRSTVGAMLTNRSASLVAPGRGNQGYGVDGSFAFYQNVSLGAYYARTSTPGLAADDDSYQGRFDYGADRYGARLEYLKVGDNFNPEVGFIRRDNFRRSFASARFSPRPRASRLVRKYTNEASLEYVENGAGFLESRQQTARFGIEFNNSDRFNVEANRNFDFLIVPFTVVRGATIPVGGYGYDDASLSYAFGAQRRLSGTVTLSAGEYYNGDIQTVSYSGGRVSVSERLSLEPSFSVSRLDLPTGEVTTTVVRTRTDYGFSPRMFASGLVQYNSTDRIFSSNLRFRWEYRPGSELFVVWTDERDTRPNSIGLRNRAFVVKATRLLRF